jgi:hypothetical protein
MHKKLLTFLGLIMSFTAGPLDASFDGQAGPTSTGEILIRLVISQGIQISNLEDIEIKVSMPVTSDINVRKRFCISSNTDGLYTITGFSDRGGSSPFSITSFSRDQVDFKLYFRSNLANSIGDELIPSVTSRQYQMEKNGVYCNGQDNVELGLVIPASEISEARDKEYRGFLNLTVAIE